jgi:putative SOS response-associated peptidase YedK
MCNDYEQHIRYAEYCKMMQELALGLPAHQGEADLPQTDNVRIGDLGPVMRASGNVIELTQMRFGFPPKGRGGPVFNFRSEGRDFSDSRRCLIPASAFFEFTGKKYPKAKHRFTFADHPMMAIAGLWRDGEANQPPSFTMLTTEPGPDVAPIHDRQVVVVPPQRWADWIYLSRPENELLAPCPAGSLRVEQVRAGSD